MSPLERYSTMVDKLGKLKETFSDSILNFALYYHLLKEAYENGVMPPIHVWIKAFFDCAQYRTTNMRNFIPSAESVDYESGGERYTMHQTLERFKHDYEDRDYCKVTITLTRNVTTTGTGVGRARNLIAHGEQVFGVTFTTVNFKELHELFLPSLLNVDNMWYLILTFMLSRKTTLKGIKCVT